MEEKEKNKKKEENCPLCEISEETLKKLREADKNKKSKSGTVKNNEK